MDYVSQERIEISTCYSAGDFYVNYATFNFLLSTFDIIFNQWISRNLHMSFRITFLSQLCYFQREISNFYCQLSNYNAISY
jgi:hypothetical protein